MGTDMTEGNSDDRLWTAEEVARFLGMHVQTVYLKANAGEIPSLKIGTKRRFRREQIEAWVAEQNTEPQPAEANPASSGAA